MRRVRVLIAALVLSSLISLGVSSCTALFGGPLESKPSAAENFDTSAPNSPSCGGLLYLDVNTDLPPTISWTSGGNGGIGLFRVRINGAPWQTVLEPPPYEAAQITAEGDYLFEVQERDEAGNWSESGSFRFRVVTDLPPAPAVTSPLGPAGLFTQDTTPTWEFTDIGSDDVVTNWRYSFNGVDWTEISPPGPPYSYTAPASPDGTYNFFVQQERALGGWTEPGSHYLTIDTVAPATPSVLLRKADGSYVAAPGTVRTHQDPLTVQFVGALVGGGNGSMEYSYDGAAPAAISELTDAAVGPLTLLPGTGILRAGEYDAAGNISVLSTGVSIGLDSTVPTVSGPALTADQRPTWSWSNTVSGSGTYEITISNGAIGFTPIVEQVSNTVYTPPTDLPTAQGQPYSVSVVAFDEYGYPSATGTLPGGTEVIPGGDLEITIVLDEPADRTITLTGDSTVDIGGTLDASVSAGFSINSYAWYAGSPYQLQSTGASVNFTPGAIGLDPGTQRLELFYTVIDGAGVEQLYSAELYFDVYN